MSIGNGSNAILQASLGDPQPAAQLAFNFDPSVIKVAPTHTETAALTVSLKEPVKESRTDPFTLELQRFFLLKDGVIGPEDKTPVPPAEVAWHVNVPASPWHHYALTSDNAAAGRPRIYKWEAEKTQHIVYLDTHNGIQELWHRGSWRSLDHSNDENGPVNAAGGPAGYVWVKYQRQHIVYRGGNNHIHQLLYSADSRRWAHYDVSEMAIGSGTLIAANPRRCAKWRSFSCARPRPGRIASRPRPRTACIDETADASGVLHRRTRLKLHDKKGALDSLAQYLGMFVPFRARG